MSTTIQVVIAILTTAGIALALSIAMTLAGAFERGATRAGRTSRDARLVLHPTQTDDARELVLR